MAAAWDDHPYTYRGYLWLYKPALKWCAEFDQSTTLSSGLYGSTDIIQYLYYGTEVIGDLSWVKDGMTIALGSTIGGWDYGWSRLRGLSGGNLPMVWNSRHGSPSEGGRPGEFYLPVTGYVSIFDDFRVWAKMPYLSVATGYWDGSNGPGGTVYRQLPVANAGTMRADWESSGVKSFDFTGEDSFAASPKGYLGQLTQDTPNTITSSSENGTNYDDNAFDDNAGTYWEGTSSSAWIKFRVSNNPVRIDITAENTAGAPKDIEIYAYHNDYIGLIQVGGAFGQTGWSAGDTRSFYVETQFGGGDWYYPREIRVWVRDTESSGNVAIREIDVYYEDRVSTSPYTWDVADGTITSGSTTTEDATVQFPIGFRHVELSVEDGESTYTGETHTPVLVAVKEATSAEVSYSGISTSESSYSGGHDASGMFDGSASTYWLVVATGADWAKVQFPSAARINKYGIYAPYLFGHPVDWKVEGSNDDVTYYILDQRSGENWATGETTKYYYLRNAIHEYVYYKLTVTANDGHANLYIMEWDLIFDEAPYQPFKNFVVTEQRLSQQGQRLTIDIYDDIDVTDYPPGTLACYWEDEIIGDAIGSLSAAGPTGRENVKFWGWLDESRESVPATQFGPDPHTTITLLDVGHRLAQLPGFPFVIEHDYTRTLPTYYNLMDGACIDRLLYLMARWLSNVAEITDFLPTRDFGLWSFSILEIAGSDLWEMMRGRAEAALQFLGVDKHGALVCDYYWQNQTNRSIPAATVSIDGDDIMDIQYTNTPTPRLHWGWASAVGVSWDDPTDGGFTVDSWCVVAPGESPGQGLRAAEQNEMLVINSSDLQERAGQLYVYENAPHSRFTIPIAHGADTGLSPGSMQYIAVTTTEAARRGYTWTAEKMMLYEMEIRHLPGQSKQVVLYLEDYIVGYDAGVIT